VGWVAFAAGLVALVWIVGGRPSTIAPDSASGSGGQNRPAGGSATGVGRAPPAESGGTAESAGRAIAPVDDTTAARSGGFLRLVDHRGAPIAEGRMVLLDILEPVSEAGLTPSAVWFTDEDGWLPRPELPVANAEQPVVGAPGFVALHVDRIPADRQVRLERAQAFAGRVLVHGDDRPLAGVVLELDEPLLGADLYLDAQRAVTDAEGGFSFASAPLGSRVTLWCSPADSGPIERTLLLVEDVHSDYTVFMPPPFAARLRIVDAHSMSPLAHMPVHIDQWEDLQTDGNGELELMWFTESPRSERSRAMDLLISADGRLTTDVHVRRDGPVIDVPLMRAVRLEVRVLAPDGAAVLGGQLHKSSASHLSDRDSAFPSGIRVDSWGRLQRGAQPGTWTLPVRAEAEYSLEFLHVLYAPLRWKFTVPSGGGVHTLDLHVSPGAEIEGTLLGAAHPLGARVAAKAGTRQWSATVDESGRFYLTGLPEGTVEFWAHHTDPDGYRYAMDPGPVASVLHTGKQTVELHLVVQKKIRSLSGKVVDEDGEPIEDARVSVQSTVDTSFNSGVNPSATNSAGAFFLVVPAQTPFPVLARVSTDWAGAQTRFESWPDPAVLQLPSMARLRAVARDSVSASPIGDPALFFRRPGDVNFKAAPGGRPLAGGEVEWELPGGPWEVRMGAFGHGLGAIERLELVSGQHAAIAQLLEPGVRAEIQVVDFTPSADATAPRLQLVPADQSRAWDEGCAAAEFLAESLREPLDGDGRAHFAAVPPGRYRLTWDGDQTLTPTQVHIVGGSDTVRVRAGP